MGERDGFYIFEVWVVHVKTISYLPAPPPARARSTSRFPLVILRSKVSDNFVRMDLKSKGSSRFKRKNSLRDKAKGGVGGRGRYRGGGGRSGSGRWAGKGGGFGGGGFGSKWGAKNDWHKRKGVEDPVTGEEGGPRDRPLSSGSAKNRAGIDVLDQVNLP